MQTNETQNFLNDFIEIMIEKMEDIKRNINSASDLEKEFMSGQIMGYYIALDTLKNQVSAFQIGSSKLDNINLEGYLYK